MYINIYNCCLVICSDVGNKFLAPHPYSGRTMQRMFGKGICIGFDNFHKNKAFEKYNILETYTLTATFHQSQ